MAYPSWVDTSLDLNLNPLRLSVEAPKKEKEQINFMESGVDTSMKDETSALVEELNRVSEENKKLTQMLTVMCENYNALRNQLMDYMSKNPEKEQSPSKKRKSESSNNFGNDNIIGTCGHSESSSSDEDECKKPKEKTIKAKISRVSVRVDSSDKSLVLKDGYQWRKYGQKVTRDNPCPRAYFKCSFAPSCPVKKKVQRSLEDQSMLVATYEGEHNHLVPSQTEVTSSSSRAVAFSSLPSSTSISTSGPPEFPDLAKSKSSQEANGSRPQVQSPEFQKFLVEQMASSLTKDPNFTAALVAAISGRNHNQNSSDNWWK